MNILLLAYACEPNRGSEPGIGWKWALQLARDPKRDVYVLTRKNNQDVIDSYWVLNQKPANLHFYYIDLGKVCMWAKHHGMLVNIYYALWLKKASEYAKVINKEIHFDVAHHITFGVFRDASMLYKLNIPYVIGPLGGGDYTPEGLMGLYSWRGKVYEGLRKLANKVSLLNPYLIRTFNHAMLILSKTEDTKHLIKRWKDKTVVKLEIGIASVENDVYDEKVNQFLYVGRFIELKGIYLILEAFKKYHQQDPESQLLLIGEGPLQGYIKSFRNDNDLTDSITVLPWMLQTQLHEHYRKSRALLFPSLHDSSGNVVLEALSNGLPVICLDCGGPASVKGKDLSLLTVDTDGKGVQEVVDSLVEKMDMLQDKEVLQKESEASLQRAKDFLWDHTVYELYDRIEMMLLHNDNK